MISEVGSISKIALYGHFSGSNLGNNATLAAVVFHLRRRLPDIELVCVSTRGPHVFEAHGIDSIDIDLFPVWSFWRLSKWPRFQGMCVGGARLATECMRTTRSLKMLEGVDQLLVAGTGVLDDFGQRTTSLPLSLFRWCLAARKCGVRTYFMSVGAGPIQNPLSRLLLKSAIRMSNYRSYRDVSSREYMESVGCASVTDRIFPDLVFGLPMHLIPDYRQLQWPPGTIGIGVMGYYGWNRSVPQSENIYRQYIRKILTFITWLVDQGYLIRLLIGDVRADQRPVNDIIQKLTENNLVSMVTWNPIKSLDDLLHEIGLTDMVVATRYHNLVCSLIMDRPTISIGYQAKNDALMASMGLGQFCQNIEDLSVDRLINQFLDLIRNGMNFIGYIKSKKHEFREQLDKQYDDLFANTGHS